MRTAGGAARSLPQRPPRRREVPLRLVRDEGAPRRELSYDAMRVAAVVGVLVSHTVYVSWLMFSYNQVPASWWLLGDAASALFRWCVPVFVMISGALLLDPGRCEPAGAFLRRRMSRVLPAFLFWGAFYSLWTLRGSLYLLGSSRTWADLAVGMLEGPVYYHLWFLYMIIGLYLLTPILRPLVRSAREGDIAYFLLLWATASGIYGLVGRVAHLRVGIPLEMVTGMVGYFILGHYLTRVSIPLRFRRLLYLASLAAASAAALLTFYLVKRHAGGFDDTFYGYLNPLTMLTAAGAFVFFRNARWDRLLPSPDSRARLERWSAAAFGIYLVHPLVLDLLSWAGIRATLLHPLLGIPLTAAAALAASYAVTRILQSAPGLRRLVG